MPATYARKSQRPRTLCLFLLFAFLQTCGNLSCERPQWIDDQVSYSVHIHNDHGHLFINPLRTFTTKKVNETSGKVISSVLALGAHVICSRIPGLTAKQKEMCRSSPDTMIAIGDGVKMAILECQEQFKYRRWNCSAIGKSDVFGHVVIVGSREAAFTYAISSAGVTYTVTSACSRGNISSCGCDPLFQTRKDIAPRGWKWGGCSADVGFGMQFARRFLDAREIEGDARSLMNLHNNKAGRKMVKISLLTECKCHGVSGSCTMKTCWKTLPSFRQIGENLMKKYFKARPVIAVLSETSAEPTGVKDVKHLRLILRKPKFEVQQKSLAKIPKRSDLVFLQGSPNYCEKDLAAGSLGTVGRFCNRTSKETDGCDLLCCGRGYNTHQHIQSWRCRCKFHWCCYVNCDTCTQKTEEYTCK